MAKSTAPNIVDRLVGFFSPVAGLQRFGARHALEKISASSRAHEASSPARSRKFYTDRLSPNQIVLQGAAALMAQARHMERNNDIARGILRTMTNNIVGPNGIGVEPQPRRRDGSIHEEYAAALRAAHREWRAAPEVTGLHTDAAMQRLLAAAPGGRPAFSAVFVANDVMALAAISRLVQAGLRVPEDVSVLGYDDDDFAPYTSPPLTTIRIPTASVSTSACRHVLNLCYGLDLTVARDFPPEVVWRASVGPGPHAPMEFP